MCGWLLYTSYTTGYRKTPKDSQCWKKSAKYTQARLPVKLLYQNLSDKPSAMSAGLFKHDKVNYNKRVESDSMVNGFSFPKMVIRYWWLRVLRANWIYLFLSSKRNRLFCRLCGNTRPRLRQWKDPYLFNGAKGPRFSNKSKIKTYPVSEITSQIWTLAV